MLRDPRAIVLAMVTLIAAGCAGSESKISRHARETWRPVSDAAVAKARDARVPKILPETHFAAARLFESQGDFRRAITQYRKAIAVNHSYVEAYHRLGLLLSMTGQRQEAITTLGRAVELKPDSAILHNNLGFELMLGKRWREAQREFLRAIELKPEFARAYINLGIVQSKLGWFDSALATFQAILPPADAYYNLGLMYRGQRRYTEAARTFQHVLSLNPDFIAAKRQLDQIASYTGPDQAAEGDTHSDQVDYEVVGSGRSPRVAANRQLTTETAFHQGSGLERTQAPAMAEQHRQDATSWDQVLARLEKSLPPSDAAGPVRRSSHTDRAKVDQTVKPWTVDQPKSPPPIDKDRSPGPRVDAEYSWADFEAMAFACDADEAISQGVCWGDSATPVCDATEFDEYPSGDFFSSKAASITEPWEAEVADDWPEAAAWTTEEPWMEEELCEDDVLLVDADAARFLTLEPSTEGAPAIPGIHENMTPFEVFEADEPAPDFSAAEWAPITFEQVSYADTESEVCIADAGEWKVCPLEPADEQPDAETSCTDSWALLRELESQLAIVRNEITCLDQSGGVAVEAITSAERTDTPAATAFPPLLGADDDQFVGPPAELARTPELTRSKARPARLVSDVVDDKASRKSDRAKRTRKPITEFKDGGPAERQRQQADEPAKEKPAKRRTSAARSMSRAGTLENPEDGSVSTRRDSGGWNATGAYGFPTASPFAILDVDADLHPERTPTGTFGWTCQMPKPSDNKEGSAVPAMDLYYSIRGACGHHIGPLPN